jgi:hypothetical protein
MCLGSRTVPAEEIESRSSCEGYPDCDRCFCVGKAECDDPTGAISVLVNSLLAADIDLTGAMVLPIERYATMLFGPASDEEWQARQLVKHYQRFVAAANSLQARIEQRKFEEAQTGPCPAGGTLAFDLSDIEEGADLEAVCRERGIPADIVPIMAQGLAHIRKMTAKMATPDAQAEEAVPDAQAEADDANTTADSDLALAPDTAEKQDCGCADCQHGE